MNGKTMDKLCLSFHFIGCPSLQQIELPSLVLVNVEFSSCLHCLLIIDEISINYSKQTMENKRNLFAHWRSC